MISQFLASVNVKNGSEIWLGGRQMDFHNFNWGDGSLFNYSYWEHGEPSFPTEKCIEMSWRNGRWNDISCRLKRAVLCERQVTSRSYLKPNLYQPTTCLDLGSQNCTTVAPAPSPAQLNPSYGSVTSLTTTLLPATASASPLLSGHASDVHQTSAGSVSRPSASSHAAGTASEIATGNASVIPAQDLQTSNDHMQPNATPADHPVNLTQHGTQSETPQVSATVDLAAPNNPTEMAPKVNEFIMTPEDRPIKVITSIIHREQQTAPQLLSEVAMVGKAAPIEQSSNGTKPPTTTAPTESHIQSNRQQPTQSDPQVLQQSNSSTTEFIHYNLPQPDTFSTGTGSTTQTISAAPAAVIAAPSQVDSSQGVNQGAANQMGSQSVTERVNATEIKSLMDKLKPPTQSATAEQQTPFDGSTTSEQPKVDSNTKQQTNAP